MNPIKEFTEHQKCTQAELADKLGYTQQYISNLAVGHHPFTEGFIGRILLAFGAEAAQFFLPYVSQEVTKMNSEVDTVIQ